MNWHNNESKKNLTKDGAMQLGFEGESRITQNFKAKIWDFDFAWRGSFRSEDCPSLDNWVAMPYNLPYLRKLNATERFHSVAEEKLERVELWEAFCGVNGTNRIKTNNLASRLQQAVQRISSQKND